MSVIDEPVSLKHSGDPTAPAGYDGDGACPTITLDCPEALQIPEHFLITFKGHRGQIVARSATRSQKASASVTLHLHALCDVEECESPDCEEAEAAADSNPIDRLFEQAQQEAPETE